jgi:very-short-patch-repair endonuclease
MNGLTLECKDKKILTYYEHSIEKLNLEYWLRKISHEYFLLGDVFVFTEIACPVCNGIGHLSNGNLCNHPDGTVKRLLILNPDFIEVQSTQLADEPTVALIPDDDLKRVVQQKKPKAVYDRIPDNIKEYVVSGRPIPLSPRCISHLRHKGSPYGTYGESLLRRLFTVIAYKTKLMTANWIMAERHILPVRVAKVGNAERPASEIDIADVQGQLAAVSNDPNLTIVTHHAFELDFIGATGKIHDISNQMEMIGKEMLDGLMLPQTLLNGEMASYSSAAVGVETLIRRLETWRMELSSWVEKNVFLPIAQMQGFVDTQKSKLIGETVWLYPKIKWNDLRLRDNTQYLQSLTQLHDKGLISTQKLLSEFNIDFDQEINRLREEQITAGKGGQVTGSPPGGGMDLGLGGMGGGMGGGMDLGGGGMPPGLSAPPPGGGAPPDMGGGMPPGMPPAVAASEDDLTKVAQLMYPEQQATQPQVERVYKKGKEPKKKDTVVPEASTEKIFLTKPEQKLYSIIQSINVPFRLFAQYEQHVAGVQNAYLLDFAFPDIMLNLEADGDFWHSDYEAVERDKVRDMKLASIGWRVVRIKESALNNNADMATQIILTNIKEAISQRKALMSKKAMITEEEYAVSYEDGDEVKISHQNFVSEEDS